MTAFHVCGIILAAWALLLSFLGVTRDDFPATPAATRTVGAISVTLTILAIGAGVYTAATEEDEGDEGEAAIVLTV